MRCLRAQLEKSFRWLHPRVQAFGIVSEKSAPWWDVVGIDFAAEVAQDLYDDITVGDTTAPDQALVGAAMARNLGAELGDDIVIRFR